MLLIYTYTGQDGAGRPVSGSVFAESEDHAFGKIKKNGFKPDHVGINWNASIGYITNKGFNEKELIRFYRQLGLRLKKSDNVDSILRDSSVFIGDPALKAAIQEAANHRGKNLGERLMDAGFDPSECESIRSSMSDGGSNGWKVFDMISNIRKKNMLLRIKMKKMMIMPIIMLTMLYASFYGVVVFLAPITIKFMKQYGIKTSDLSLLAPVYDLSIWVQSNMITFHIVYAVLLGLVVFAFKSSAVRDFLTNYGYIAKLKEINAMIFLWSQFSVLYQANISIQTITRKISAASTTMRFRMAFNSMGRKLTEGKDISDSISLTKDFPDYVRASLASAAKSDFNQGITDMIETLEIDQEALFERIEGTVKTISFVVGVTTILFMFALIMMPNLIISQKLMG